MTCLLRCLFALGWFVLASAPLAAADDVFPRPPELERDVAFWLQIFSEVRADEGLLHDNRNLAIVYERIATPASISRRERNRRIANARTRYGKVLETLATGKRDGLGDEEQRVLALWGDADSQTLRNAARRIRFQQGLSDRFAESIRRSGRWREHIESVLGENGVPLELAALPHVESSYNPAARSHVGASGIWQFTRSTGRRFMQVDHVVDGRNDPFIASEAAARLLAYNYSLTGNWPMAITAYNHGLAGARRAMQAHGDTAYVDILRNYSGRLFGFASRNFYVAFLAAVEVDQNQQRYFPGIVPEPADDSATFTVPAYVSVDALAEAAGIGRADILRHNPALQATVAEGSKYVPRNLTLRLPRDVVGDDALSLVARIPESAMFDAQLPDLFHTIRRGDTLSEIADEYGTSVRTLVALNALGSRHRIRAGQRLRLPAAGPLPADPAPEPEVVAAVPDPPPRADLPLDLPAAGQEPLPADSGPIIADESDGASATDSPPASLLSDPSDYAVAEDRTIEVQPQETLGHYADWLGVRTQAIRDRNGFAFRRPVVVGERIELVAGAVDAAEFERRRVAHHKAHQDAFFRDHKITGVREHKLAGGESLWVLSHRSFGVPVWLLRQYNPELDLQRVRAGTRVRYPVLDANDG